MGSRGDLSYLIAPFLLGTLDDSFGPEARPPSPLSPLSLRSLPDAR